MDLKTARAKYKSQKHGAKRRGIEWRLTFAQWLEWWGEDLARRGSGVDDLQMQRIGDAGPYELGNIRKGHPRQNARTYSAALQNRKSEAAKAAREAALDAADVLVDGEPEDESISSYMGRDHGDALGYGCKWDRLHR